jgi:single-stranded-DNA-specific exonuclease
MLENYNQQRQQIERRIAVQAREVIEANRWHDEAALVLGSTEWHPGVIGIVAGRLVEQFGKPVFLLALRDDGTATGSGRSIPGFELHNALHRCTDILHKHGGHAMAAGVTLDAKHITEFRTRFNTIAREQFNGVPPPPLLTIDAEVPLTVMTTAIMKEIDRLEPYGADNPRPRFLATGLSVDGEPRKVGVGERHISFKVKQGNTGMRAIAFGMAERLDELIVPGSKFAAVFTPRINEWQGYRNVQMEVLDFRMGETVELV